MTQSTASSRWTGDRGTKASARRRRIVPLLGTAVLAAAALAAPGVSPAAGVSGRPSEAVAPRPPTPCDRQLFLSGLGVGSLIGLSARDSSTPRRFPIGPGDAVADWFVVPTWGGIAVRTDLGLAYFWGPNRPTAISLPDGQIATGMYPSLTKPGAYITTETGRTWFLDGTNDTVTEFLLPEGELFDHVADEVAIVSQTGKAYFFADGGTPFALPEGLQAANAFSFATSGRSFVVTTTGRVFGRGAAPSGELGSGATALATDPPVEFVLPGGELATEVIDAYGGTLVRTVSGHVYGAGENDRGQLGTGTTTDTLTPVLVPIPDSETPAQIESYRLAGYGSETVTVVRAASGRVFRAGSRTSQASVVEFTLEDGVTASEVGVINGPVMPYLWALGDNGGLYVTSLYGEHGVPTVTMDRYAPDRTFLRVHPGYSGQLFLATANDLYELTGNEDDFIDDYTLTRRFRSTSTGTLQQVAVDASASLTAVLTESGDVLGRGYSTWGQLGVRTNRAVTTPKRYPLPRGYFAQHTSVASGNQLVVEACPLPLAPVLSANGTIGNRSVTLTWDVPFIQRGRVSNYVIEYSKASGPWTRVRKSTSSSRTFQVKGLSNGSSYRFRIAATNVTGTGPWLETDPFVPHTTPGSPQSFTVTPGDHQLALSWTAPTNDGGAPILDYRVQYSPPSGGWITWDDGVGTGTSATITGLVNGRKYRVRVQAVNDAGRGTSTIIRTRRPTAS